MNWRTHPEQQKDALRAMLNEVGFARSVTAFEHPEHGLTLIDGHLRTELDPEAEVVVEVLDVTEEEANKLLLTMDPIALLAKADEDKRRELFESIKPKSEAAKNAFKKMGPKKFQAPKASEVAKEYHVIVKCEDEQHQLELLERFQDEGLSCKAVFS
jgi:hypothetical protein